MLKFYTDTSEEMSYLQEPLVLEDEVRAFFWSLPSQKATGTHGMSTEI